MAPNNMRNIYFHFRATCDELLNQIFRSGKVTLHSHLIRNGSVTLGTLLLTLGWDGRHTSGMRCCSVLYRLRVYRFGNDIYGAILYRV